MSSTHALAGQCCRMDYVKWTRPAAQGWICNSSICMTRRGMRPTGIAIYEAQEKGFASVAHFVQVEGLCGNSPIPLFACVRLCSDRWVSS